MALSGFLGRVIQKLAITPTVQAAVAADPSIMENRLFTESQVSFDPVEGARLYAEATAKQNKATAQGLAVIAAAAPFLAPLAGATTVTGKLVAGAASKLASSLPTRPPPPPQPTTGGRPVFTDAEGNFSLGATAETLLQIALNRSATPDYGQQPVNTMLPVVQTAAAGFPALPSFLGGLATAGRAAVGVVRSVGGRILGWVLPSGQKVTRKAAVNMAKQFGLTATASALGIGAVELAEAIVDESRTPRRGKGITAAAIRTTTRTMNKLERAHSRVARFAAKARRCK